MKDGQFALGAFFGALVAFALPMWSGHAKPDLSWVPAEGQCRKVILEGAPSAICNQGDWDEHIEANRQLRELLDRMKEETK